MQKTERSKIKTRYLECEGNEKSIGVPLTLEKIEEYLNNLAAKGRVPGTIDGYRRGLRRLYHELPEGDKEIRSNTLRQWREHLLEEGYSATAVNLFIVAANGYLDFVHARDLQITDKLKVPKELQPELTRREYLQLLSTARVLGRERAYLLIKVFGNTNLPVHELSNLTVEAIQKGKLSIEYNQSREIIRIPKSICEELLSYAERKEIHSGPVFLTRSGVPMSRSNITVGIRQLCIAAGVPVEKGNPRCLRKLYQSLRTDVERNIALLVDQAQDRLLEEEELVVGWGKRE